MVAANTSRRETAFCVSIDAQAGTTTGISAADRAAHRSARRSTQRHEPRDLARPGHCSRCARAAGGVLVRAGQTEAAVDLARIAGLYPAGVICEIMNEDGTMARVPELAKFAQQARAADDHDRRSDPVPDAHGVARQARRQGEAADRVRRRSAIIALESQLDGQTHVALVRGDIGDGEGRAGPRALEVPHRRRASLDALRLRAAARRRDGADRRRKAAACSCI